MDQYSNTNSSSNGDSPVRPGQKHFGNTNSGPGRYNNNNNRRRKPRPHNPSATLNDSTSITDVVSQSDINKQGAQSRPQGIPSNAVHQGKPQGASNAGSQVNRSNAAPINVANSPKTHGTPHHTPPPKNNVGQQQQPNSRFDRAGRTPQRNPSTQNNSAGRETSLDQANNNNPSRPISAQSANNSSRNDKPARNWNNQKIIYEETLDDIRKENERVEKEIWLEIAVIHNMRLD